MEKILLHTPEGVRDIYNDECKIKLQLQKNIHNMFTQYGYEDIQTPTFEFFDIFNKERGSIPSKEMYKFFDREGNTLVLRPDMTPAIARAVAKYYSQEEMPIRMCYQGNTYVNNSEYQGKLKETTQMGAELINDTSSDADSEIISLVIDSLLASGLKEFQVDIGQVDFFEGIIEEAKLSEEALLKLIELISNKNLFGIEELLESESISNNNKEILLKIPELFGGYDILEKARQMVTNKKSLDALVRLEKVYETLKLYGFEKYISFDLGMLSGLKYYTGIIFKAYTYGTGASIVTGGRYDKLLKQFGKNSASIGFGIYIDQLMMALTAQKINTSIKVEKELVIYENSTKKSAIDYVISKRENKENLVLIKKSGKKSLEDLIDYANRSKFTSVTYVEKASVSRNCQLCDDLSVDEFLKGGN